MGASISPLPEPAPEHHLIYHVSHNTGFLLKLGFGPPLDTYSSKYLPTFSKLIITVNRIPSSALQAVMAVSIEAVFVGLPHTALSRRRRRKKKIITDPNFVGFNLDPVGDTDHCCITSNMDRSGSSTQLTRELRVFPDHSFGHVTRRSEWKYLAAGTNEDSSYGYRPTRPERGHPVFKGTTPGFLTKQSGALTLNLHGRRRS